jgi:hypothetical protein
VVELPRANEAFRVDGQPTAVCAVEHVFVVPIAVQEDGPGDAFKKLIGDCPDPIEPGRSR